MIGFIIGCFVGNIIGFLTAACVQAAKDKK